MSDAGDRIEEWMKNRDILVAPFEENDKLRKLNAAYESELRDYAKTVARLNGELAEAHKNNGEITLYYAQEMDKLREERDHLRTTLEAAQDALKETIQSNTANYEEAVKLRAEVEAKRLKWQTGPIPKDGDYFRKPINYGPDLIHLSKGSCYKFKWAGPIEPPEEV